MAPARSSRLRQETSAAPRERSGLSAYAGAAQPGLNVAHAGDPNSRHAVACWRGEIMT